MNDPRGILEEFVERATHFGKAAPARFDGVHLNLEPEHLRAAYRERHEALGICRSCKRDARPGRKYCVVHLAKANERARRSQRGASSS